MRYEALSFPFLGGGDPQQRSDSGGDVLDIRASQRLVCRKGPAAAKDGDAHILLAVKTMHPLVPAVIGGDDNGIIVRNRPRRSLDAVPGLADGFHIFRPHPAPIMANLVG